MKLSSLPRWLTKPRQGSPSGSRKEWPIIVGGAERSGTTLFRRLLNGHPRIFCPSEIKLHKDLLGQWQPGADPLAGLRLGATINALRLPKDVWLDEFTRALARCYGLAAQASGKVRWADKNPENALNAPLWDRALDGRMFFILVTRHPLDILASISETPFPRTIPAGRDERAEHVKMYLERGLAFVDKAGDRGLLVRYEDLVGDCEGAARRAMERLEEDFDPAMIRSLGKDSRHGGGLGDPKSLGRSEISATNVGRWRRDLPREDAVIAWRSLSRVASRLGYDGP